MVALTKVKKYMLHSSITSIGLLLRMVLFAFRLVLAELVRSLRVIVRRVVVRLMMIIVVVMSTTSSSTAASAPPSATRTTTTSILPLVFEVVDTSFRSYADELL